MDTRKQETTLTFENLIEIASLTDIKLKKEAFLKLFNQKTRENIDEVFTLLFLKGNDDQIYWVQNLIAENFNVMPPQKLDRSLFSSKSLYFQALLNAGTSELLFALLKQSNLINEQDEMGSTLLHHYCSMNMNNIFPAGSMVLTSCFDINLHTKNKKGLTVLQVVREACLAGQYGYAGFEMLLKRSTEITEQDIELILAAKHWPLNNALFIALVYQRNGWKASFAFSKLEKDNDEQILKALSHIAKGFKDECRAPVSIRLFEQIIKTKNDIFIRRALDEILLAKSPFHMVVCISLMVRYDKVNLLMPSDNHFDVSTALYPKGASLAEVAMNYFDPDDSLIIEAIWHLANTDFLVLPSSTINSYLNLTSDDFDNLLKLKPYELFVELVAHPNLINAQDKNGDTLLNRLCMQRITGLNRNHGIILAYCPSLNFDIKNIAGENVIDIAAKFDSESDVYRVLPDLLKRAKKKQEVLGTPDSPHLAFSIFKRMIENATSMIGVNYTHPGPPRNR